MLAGMVLAGAGFGFIWCLLFQQSDKPASLFGICRGIDSFVVAKGGVGVKESLAVPPRSSQVNGGTLAAASGVVPAGLLLVVLDGLSVMLECVIDVPSFAVDDAELMVSHGKIIDSVGW
jgi:hypothetical protein